MMIFKDKKQEQKFKEKIEKLIANAKNPDFEEGHKIQVLRDMYNVSEEKLNRRVTI